MTELTLSEPEIPEEAILPNKFCTFPSRPNLMKLNVNLARENSPFGQVLQKLVDSAPNLLVLIISGNQTPSLAECKMLQVLKFRGTYKPEGEIMFSMNKLNGMLVAVKDTLVELVLQMDGVGGNFITGGQSYGADDKFSLPKMPLLTILTVIEVGVFTIENEWSSETVPMLKDLCLRSKRRFGVISCLSSLQSPHDCVESLDILGAETPDAIKYIKLTFPNMNKLEVGIVCPDFTDVNKCKNFKRRIEAFDKLERLELLKITISGINRFLYSLILLECISKINATILLRLQFTQSAYVDTFTQPAFETILELCKAMNKVTIEGLGLIPPIAKEVNNSIKSNNIPVNIIPKKIYGNIKIFHNGEFYDI
ncbi:hypothetical protein Fcan01_27808 [Folsomia candida]|uniref:Uncharacterized protein n=2 Tax=Folsomia candida TaxID=158441 RepID=A0A226CWR6_FOLCA|nr:hypothetical protein Fcan01_27808 [Folsomia candida]